jgi:hypothetical protein
MPFSCVHVGRTAFQTNPLNRSTQRAQRDLVRKFSAASAFSCKAVWGFGCGCAALCALCPKNSGSVIPKPERQNQKFCWLRGFLLNPALSASGKARLEDNQSAPGCLASEFLPGLILPYFAASFDAICVVCRPWKRAIASSFALGHRSPCAPVIVDAPYGEPPVISLISSNSFAA